MNAGILADFMRRLVKDAEYKVGVVRIGTHQHYRLSVPGPAQASSSQSQLLCRAGNDGVDPHQTVLGLRLNYQL